MKLEVLPINGMPKNDDNIDRPLTVHSSLVKCDRVVVAVNSSMECNEGALPFIFDKPVPLRSQNGNGNGNGIDAIWIGTLGTLMPNVQCPTPNPMEPQVGHSMAGNWISNRFQNL